MTENHDFEQLKKFIMSKGFDCSYYRDPYLERRINLRMGRCKIETFMEYIQYIEHNPEEFQVLVDCLAVNVTSFFRDKVPFRVLGKQVFPQCAADKRADGSSQVSVWSAACSTGEEPYSIAITALESIRAYMASGLRVSITATDIDQQALLSAHEGEYKKDQLSMLSDKELRRYFYDNDTTYGVKEIVRNMVSFKCKDLISDEPVGGVDIVFCRNMLIYITMSLQEKIFDKFYAALNPGGYLFIGKTEILPLKYQRLYRTVNSAERVYQKQTEEV